MSPIERLKPLYASPPSRGVCPALIRLFNLNQILAQKELEPIKISHGTTIITHFWVFYRILEDCTVTFNKIYTKMSL